MRVM